MKKLILISMLLVFASCSSSPLKKEVSTMDGISRPDWATEQQGFIQGKEEIHFLGVYEIEKTRNLNMNSVKKASELKGWEEASKKMIVEYENEAIIENQGMESKEELWDRSRLATKALMKNASVSGRWYRVTEEEHNDDTLQKVQYFTKITIKNNDFLKAVKSMNRKKNKR
jgi:hypothetical protein